MYNTIWHEGLHNNVGMAIFLLTWSVHHGDMKLMKNSSAFSSLLAFSDQKG
jgi:hypothetical protein